MAEVATAGKIYASGSPTNIGSQRYAVTYDFSEDGGATADTYTLIEFEDAVAISLVCARVETAGTSGGSATISLGVTASGTEFLSTEAIETFAAGAVINADDPGAYFKVEDGEKIVMAVGTADLTAGKFEFLFDVVAA